MRHDVPRTFSRATVPDVEIASPREQIETTFTINSPLQVDIGCQRAKLYAL